MATILAAAGRFGPEAFPSLPPAGLRHPMQAVGMARMVLHAMACCGVGQGAS